jgi:hypothetical protein
MPSDPTSAILSLCRLVDDWYIPLEMFEELCTGNRVIDRLRKVEKDVFLPSRLVVEPGLQPCVFNSKLCSQYVFT